MAKKGLVIAAVAAVMGAGAAGGMFYWQTRDGATRETLKQGIAAAAPKVAYVEVKEMT